LLRQKGTGFLCNKTTLICSYQLYLRLIPLNHAEAEKVDKDRAQSAERIHTLHTRLHQEAEKIRKWKTSTEIEIKEKVKSICYHTFFLLFGLNWF